MGQAKARGSFAQRQVEGIARLDAKAAERERKASASKKQEIERRIALYHSDPEQYEREKRNRNRAGEKLAMLAAMMADPFSKLRR